MSHLQSRPKLRSSVISHNSSRSTSIDSRSKTQSPILDSSHHISTESSTDRATFSFVRRTLCSQLGDKGRSACATIDEILPPLTSSNEVDLQLYAFIAIVVREYIQTWYQKITSDQVFVEELVNIFAHCTRALEQRLRKVDLESLLLDEIPELLETHIHAFHVSHLPLHRPPIEHDPRHIYHLLWPIPPLSPVPSDQQDVASRQQQVENESSYRQLLVQGALALLLPTEDLENNCLRSLVTEILSESILGSGIGEKASEPWILWEGITKIAVVAKSQISQTKTQGLMDQSVPSSNNSTCQESFKKGNLNLNVNYSVQKVFWLFLQYSFFVITAIHYLIITYTASSSQACRNKSRKKKLSEESHIDDPDLLLTHQVSKKPILDMKLWSCWAILLNLELRMPWLKAMLSMLQWAALTGPGKIGQTDGIIDKILSYIIHTHILTPTTLPTLLRNARSALFPNNLAAGLSKKPTEAECVAIRRRCAVSILELIPTGVRNVYFGLEWEDMVREVEEEVLCIFEDKFCNKHLLYGLVELILVRLMPELSVTKVSTRKESSSKRRTSTRRTLTDEQRRQICEYKRETPNMRQADIAAQFAIERSTVSKVLKNKEKHLANSTTVCNPPKRKKGKFQKLERTISNWILNEVDKGRNVTDDEIKRQACKFAELTNDPDSLIKCEDKNWLAKFNQRNSSETTRRHSEPNSRAKIISLH
ncbi:hypothetical protein EPUL_004923, partial [Erysiphe pulchra]